MYNHAFKARVNDKKCDKYIVDGTTRCVRFE
jgi:hypothetical protein